MKTIEAIHSSGFIHGDFKIDNVLIRTDDVPGGSSKWQRIFDPLGDGGWSSFGIKLIDFGRSIDISAFPQGQQFRTELEKVDEFDCYEIRENKSWSYQIDYHGLASVSHCLLFGKFMTTKEITVADGSKKWTIEHNFKRYHQVGMWNKYFDTLLNSKSVGSLPITQELGYIRKEMEDWLVKNSTCGLGLKFMLSTVERFGIERQQSRKNV